MVANFLEARQWSAIGWWLLSLRGVFNSIALHLHAKDAIYDPENARASTFMRGHISVQSIPPLNGSRYDSFTVGVENQMTQIHEQNVASWAAMGIAYEDGILGSSLPSDIGTSLSGGASASGSDFASALGSGRFM